MNPNKIGVSIFFCSFSVVLLSSSFFYRGIVGVCLTKGCALSSSSSFDHGATSPPKLQYSNAMNASISVTE
ncbi:hypothetical protein LOK49_LG08G02837 [Camellia lanceoleosa]|uniref:Uncharacterized protein n=1 Tax=Camellia lanceoleosa TaxID=1840588 RepID=A0ACC0GNK6_9ERIC|nr:hypothetical protein LOK49_LG08G02837 [Camellia lanceoleosa]